MKQLEQLVERRLLAPIDAKFGGFLVRRLPAALAPGERDTVGIAGALLSAERARGHSCIDLSSVAGTPPWGDDPSDATLPTLPTLDACRATFAQSALCGDGSTPSPLVLDGTRLYLYRYYAAEVRLARAVRDRTAMAPATDVPDPAVVALFRELFPRDAGSTDWQSVAAASALRGSLSIITGGPGTGKTTTAAKSLALLLRQDPTLRIALAAPTGRAAARLAEAIASGAAALRVDDGARARLERGGATLHKLLGYRPFDDTFAHCAENPLADDVVVVDEASMADLLMMDALFSALRPAARIILLGDPDQLASVDTGYVLGDLCRAADACGAEHGARLAKWFEQLSGESLASSADAPALRDAVVQLRRSYRFERHAGIGALAEAVRDGDAAASLAVLDDCDRDDVSRRESVDSTDALLEPILPSIERYLAARTPADALAALGEFRILCALRDGARGVAGINEAVEWWLRTRGIPTRARWYEGRPVLVTANDSNTGLSNGDVGVTFTGSDGRKLVYFGDGARGTRAISPARLPEHETAWAITVHKAQGSEFTHVLLVLPGEDARVLTRELLYTAVTRARESVSVVGRADIIARAVHRSTTRMSGLMDRVLSGM